MTARNEAKIATEKRVRIGWETVETAIDSIAYQLQAFTPQRIIGVARGGLLPAVMLSHKLNIPMSTIAVSAYEGTRRTLNKPLYVDANEELIQMATKVQPMVIVDDVIDSADTYDAIRTLFPQAVYASLVTKRLTIRTVYAIHVPNGVWVEFPWEVKPL